jgi:hypothetical protein
VQFYLTFVRPSQYAATQVWKDHCLFPWPPSRHPHMGSMPTPALHLHLAVRQGAYISPFQSLTWRHGLQLVLHFLFYAKPKSSWTQTTTPHRPLYTATQLHCLLIEPALSEGQSTMDLMAVVIWLQRTGVTTEQLCTCDFYGLESMMAMLITIKHTE